MRSRVAAMAAVLFMACLACVPQWARAQSPSAPVHRLTASTERIELTGAVGFLADPGARFTLDEVAKAAADGRMKTIANPRIPMLRIDHGDAIWIKLDVVSDASAPPDWMLEIPRPNIDHLQVYERAATGAWTAFPEVGAAHRFSTRVVNHRNLVFPFHLEPGSSASFLVRVKYAGPSAPHFFVWRPDALWAADREMLAFTCLYFGLVGGMLLYNALLYIVVRSRGYLLYTGSVLFTASGFAAASGIGAQYAWGHWPWWSSHAIYMSYGIAMWFSATLTRHFLQTRKRLPWGDVLLRAVAWVAAAAALIAAVFPSNIAAAVMVPLGITAAAAVSGTAVVAAVRRLPGARYFFAAWACMYVGVLAVIARLFGFLPDGIYTENALAIASAFEMTLLSLALADRINEERRSREQAQSITLGILRASQVLGSETRMDQLHSRVCEIMATLTDATHVQLLLFDADLRQWFLYGAGGAEGRVPLEEAGSRGLVTPQDVLAVEHSREPFVAGEATLVHPVIHQGRLTGMLLLENRASQGRFDPAALDALQAIAAPLAVSLENVQLYERLEQRVAERTRELRETQEQLVATARRAGMAEIATNVLHNVGNTLNSVNVAAVLVRSRIEESRAARGLRRAAELVAAHLHDLPSYLQSDAKGRQVPGYVLELTRALEREREDVLAHMGHLMGCVDHIKNVVATQQAYAGPSVMTEWVAPAQLLDDAVRIAGAADDEVVREMDDVPPARLDKTRILQILVNLVGNARQAMEGASDRKLTVHMRAVDGKLRYEVADTGIGIAPENLSRIFSHGFTTRKGGHGFGLHSCALAAVEMGGTLTAHSDGEGRGAAFALEVPLVAAA